MIVLINLKTTHRYTSIIMKLAIIATIIGSAAAFAPSNNLSSNTALNAVTELNGWVADVSKPCYGLPGK